MTGARSGEAQKLQLRDVDRARGKALLRETKGKDDNPREVALAPMLIEALRVHIAELGDVPGDTLLFGFATRWGLPQMVTRVRKRAGLKHYRPHQIGRHAFATRLLHGGASLMDVQKGGGWKKAQQVTDTYGHLAQEHVDRVVSGVDTKALYSEPKAAAERRRKEPSHESGPIAARNPILAHEFLLTLRGGRRARRDVQVTL